MSFRKMNDRDVLSIRFRESIKLLCTFSDESWCAGERYFSVTEFKEGELVLRQGDVTDDVKILVSGIARAFYLNKIGKEFNHDFLYPIKLASNSVSVIRKQPSTFSIQAMTFCRCVTIKYEHVIALGEKYPEWRALHIRFLQEYMILKEKREAEFLLCSAEERYMIFLKDFASILEFIPNFHVASYLGITPVALSRIRQRIRAVG